MLPALSCAAGLQPARRQGSALGRAEWNHSELEGWQEGRQGAGTCFATAAGSQRARITSSSSLLSLLLLLLPAVGQWDGVPLLNNGG